jgi:hypothetical protein
MPLKTSYFNSGIFKNNIKRFWLITFSYTFFMFLLIIGYLNSAIERINRIDDYEVLIYIGKSIFNTNDIMVIFLGFYPLVTALAMFSYMHFQKNTAMIHSLPVSRSTLFVTNYLSGLFVVSFPLIFNSAILIAFEIIAGIPNSSYAWMWFGINLVLTFLLYNFAVFAGMFTGHLAAHAIFFYIFNFLALFLETVIKSILNNFLFGYASYYSSRTFDAWSPLYYLQAFYRGFQNDKGNITAIAGYLIAGIIFLVASYFLYKKRHMEVATDVISYSFVKPVFKYGVAFCSAALIGSIIVSILNVHQNLVAYIITYLIGGFIGYFSAEMLMRKTFKVFKTYKGYIVFALILSLFLCSINFDLYGYERRIPQYSEVEIMCLNTYLDSSVRIALRPEDYDPEMHSYLIPTREYSGKFRNEPPRVLSDEHIKELRESIPGIFDNYEVITKVRQIHSYIVENENLFKENEKLMHKDITGQQADLFKNRNLYFIYRLEDGSFLERQYSLLTYQDNTELDKLLREYLALPGVRESYMPVLSKNADDIQSAYVSFETKDGHYQDFEITEDMQGFLDVYKKDILAEDSLKSMFRESEPYDYDVYVRIDFKNELLNRTGAHSNRLYNQFENTMNYLVDKGIIKLEDLMESEYNLKYSPAAIAIPR